MRDGDTQVECLDVVEVVGGYDDRSYDDKGSFNETLRVFQASQSW